MKKILFLILTTFVFANIFQIAHAAKGFVVEKSGSDKILISDGYSEYIIEHDYDCYSSDFYEGATIYIDTSYSPSYGDKIIISGYSDTICEITSSEDVNIKRYYVDDVYDSEDKIIVTDKNSDKFLVEYGIGCGLSMWRYEGKTIDIDIGGSLLDGIGDRIYLFDSGKDCKVWDVDELGASKSRTYNSPATITCPSNSSPDTNGKCTCNAGYLPSGNACITYSQSCQNQYGANSYGDGKLCYCAKGYQWNLEKTACIITPSCADGYVLDTNSQCITYTQSCQLTNNNDINITGTKGADGQIACNCVGGYVWDGKKCSVIVVTTEKSTPIVEAKKAPPKIIKAAPAKKTITKNSSIHAATTTPTTTATIKTKVPTGMGDPKPGFFQKVFNFLKRVF